MARMIERRIFDIHEKLEKAKNANLREDFTKNEKWSRGMRRVLDLMSLYLSSGDP